jgi:TonB family protein
MKTLILIAIAVLLLPVQARAQDSVAAARDLYASAAYDEALVVLNRLDVSGRPVSDRLEVNQYRAFCLVALRRTEEAERAIEAVVSDEPLYHPAGAEASPRLISAFATVRQRMLPAIVQQKYAHAKSAFDKKDFPAAVAEFDQVLKMFSDADLRDAGGRPPLSDVRTLASGFRDLSVQAIPPAPVVIAAPAVPVPPPLPMAVANRIYVPGESGVVPPAIVRQDLPPFQQNGMPASQGVLEVIINEQGAVESAMMRTSMNPRYDSVVLTAARTWRYKPAMVSGTPVKFRKLITISVKP